MVSSASPRMTRLLLEALVKHLPPSASTLRLLDVGGGVGDVLTELRPDVEAQVVSPDAAEWALPDESADAVVAFEQPLRLPLLEMALRTLRPGGRLIVVHSQGEVSQEAVTVLEAAGYTRILVEAGIECPLPAGVLMRGEKPHTEHSTQERIRKVASSDQNAIDLAEYRGRYVHLLVQQKPNKPIWALQPGEQVEWHALSLEQDGEPLLLAFSSLPNAVAFMQPAVVAGQIKDVNKVAKFSRETAQLWQWPVLLNPKIDILKGRATLFVAVDPGSAAAPNE